MFWEVTNGTRQQLRQSPPSYIILLAVLLSIFSVSMGESFADVIECGPSCIAADASVWARYPIIPTGRRPTCVWVTRTAWDSGEHSFVSI